LLGFRQAALLTCIGTGRKGDRILISGPVNQSSPEVEEKNKWHVIPEQSAAFAVVKA
jgi:hypothetical protein